MKCLILAAGYATRLYPLTENFPKPLLKVGDKTILDWLIDDIDTAGLVDEYIVISNHKFAPVFADWAAGRCPVAAGHDGGVAAGHDGGVGTGHDDTLRHAALDLRHPGLDLRHPGLDLRHSGLDLRHSGLDLRHSGLDPESPRITVLDDGTSTNETRLGAVRDIQFAIDTLGLDDDLLVIAGDNLLDFSLVRFLEYARGKGTSCIMRYYEPSEERLHKTGVAVVDENDLILEMEEKPAHPKSHWCCPPFYFYRRSDVPLVKVGIDNGCGVDAPGSFIAWLSAQTPVHAWEMPGRRYDIGNLASYEEVKRNYRGIPPKET